jgi:hypothetical protein
MNDPDAGSGSPERGGAPPSPRASGLNPPPGLMMTPPTPPFLGGDEPLGTSIPTSLPLEVERWTTENVSEWLASVDLPRLAPPFAEQGIDGYLLLRLTERDLDQDLAIPSNLQRVKVFRAIANLRRVVAAAAPDTSSYPTTRDSDSAVSPKHRRQSSSSGAGAAGSGLVRESSGTPSAVSGSGSEPRTIGGDDRFDRFDRFTAADVSWLQAV